MASSSYLTPAERKLFENIEAARLKIWSSGFRNFKTNFSKIINYLNKLIAISTPAAEDELYQCVFGNRGIKMTFDDMYRDPAVLEKDIGGKVLQKELKKIITLLLCANPKKAPTTLTEEQKAAFRASVSETKPESSGNNILNPVLKILMQNQTKPVVIASGLPGSSTNPLVRGVTPLVTDSPPLVSMGSSSVRAPAVSSCVPGLVSTTHPKSTASSSTDQPASKKGITQSTSCSASLPPKEFKNKKDEALAPKFFPARIYKYIYSLPVPNYFDASTSYSDIFNAIKNNEEKVASKLITDDTLLTLSDYVFLRAYVMDPEAPHKCQCSDIIQQCLSTKIEGLRKAHMSEVKRAEVEAERELKQGFKF